MKRVCVTGAGGFIGGHLCRYLKEQGHWVRGVDIKSPIRETNTDEFEYCDLRHYQCAESVVKDVDWVFALAADKGGAGYISWAHADIILNSTAISLNTIRTAFRAKVERLLFTSSVCVYPTHLLEANEPVPLRERDGVYPAQPEGCLTPDTEVMTRDGFKFIPDITLDDEVATLSSEGYLEFHKPSDKQVIEYVGRLIHFKARSYDCLVTPAHRVFAACDRNTMPARVEAQEFIADSRFTKGFFKRNCMWRDNQEHSGEVVIPSVFFEVNENKAYRGKRKKSGYVFKLDDYLEFLGWFITEGNCGFHHGKDYVVQIRQRDQDNLMAIKSLCDRMGVRVSGVPDERIVISSKVLWAHFKEFGHGARNKNLPNWVLELPSEKLRILYKAMMLGDGSRDWDRYFTSSSALRDQFIEICMKIGYTCSVLTRPPSGNIGERYCISIAMKNHVNKVTNKNISHVEYTGLVYDLTVPNHVFYIRRNGRHVWTGNSYGWEKLHTEHICHYVREDGRLNTRIVRLHNCYGPFDDTWDNVKAKAPAAFCRKIAASKLTDGAPIEVWGNGKQVRSFMYVADCVVGLVKLMESDFPGPLNMGYERAYTVDELVSTIMDVADHHPEQWYNPDGPTGVGGRMADNTLCREVLNWEPTVSLREGMEKTYPWIEAQVKESLK